MSCTSCTSGVEGHVHYLCETCGARVCEACFFDEAQEAHPHSLTKQMPAGSSAAFFSVEDPVTGHHVYLGNLAAAEPGSQTLEGAPHIRCVVSCVTMSELERHGESSLARVYAGNTTAEARGVRYHRLEVEDVSAPRFLAHAAFLEEATVYMDSALALGSVLVHCVHGEKRSPTALLAWLCTRGWKVGDAINLVDESYSGRPGWAANYRSTRKAWIEELKAWAPSWRQRQSRWAARLRTEKVAE